MAPSACNVVQLLLFLLPFVRVTLTAPDAEYAFEILPSSIEISETSGTSEKSSPVNTSPSDAGLATSESATKSSTRVHVAPIPPPRFPLTYDGLLRRRRGAPDTQYPYDEAPQHPRAPSARRSLHSQRDSPLDAPHVVVPCGSRKGTTDRNYHERIRKTGKIRHMIRINDIVRDRPVLPFNARGAMRRDHGYDPERSDQVENRPSEALGVVNVYVLYNQPALRKKGNCHDTGCQHHARDTMNLFENSPDTQNYFELRHLHQDVASKQAYQYPQNADSMFDDYYVHNIQRDPVFYKINIPFRGKAFEENPLVLDGRRDQFSDVSSNNENNPDSRDDSGMHGFHTSYKLLNHPKYYKLQNRRSFGFRDVLHGSGSPYSRLSHSGRSYFERIPRRSAHTKRDSPDINGFHRDDPLAHHGHHIPHVRRPCMKHAFRSVVRNASSSQNETASPSSAIPKLVSPSSAMSSSVTTSSASTSSASSSSGSASSASPSSASPSSALPSSAESISPGLVYHLRTEAE